MKAFNWPLNVQVVLYIAFTAALFSMRSVTYWDGRHLTSYSLLLALVSAVIGMITFVTIFASLVASGAASPSQTVIRLLLLASFCFMAGWSCSGQRGNYKVFLDGFAARSERHINAQNLQNWAVELLDQHENAHTYNYVRPQDLPDFVRKLKASGVLITSFVYTHARFVQLEFGGGFEHFGIIVGRRTLALCSNEALYLEPWAPGLYFYYSLP
jgi:hypothetical protein